jgi:hypothetical protein
MGEEDDEMVKQAVRIFEWVSLEFELRILEVRLLE